MLESFGEAPSRSARKFLAVLARQRQESEEREVDPRLNLSPAVPKNEESCEVKVDQPPARAWAPLTRKYIPTYPAPSWPYSSPNSSSSTSSMKQLDVTLEDVGVEAQSAGGLVASTRRHLTTFGKVASTKATQSSSIDVGLKELKDATAQVSTRRKKDAASASSRRPAKRIRTLSGPPSSAAPSDVSSSPLSTSAPTSPVTSSNRRGPRASTKGKRRQRRLQPDLARNHGCLHGCTLAFTTAYEVRRHQEDAHGREEALFLIASAGAIPDGVAYPKDYPFLIEIGLYTVGPGAWDPNVKASFMAAVKADEEPLSETLAEALLAFAREWSKRYQCPRCGESFSRMDSRKRHLSKQCP